MKRKYSIGGNDLLYLHKSKNADAFMRIYNVSDVEGDMCGNGSLCVGKYLCEKLGKNKVKIETLGGIKTVETLGNDKFKVEMGNVKYTFEEVSKFFEYNGLESIDKTLELKFKIAELPEFQGSVVHIGEPHLIVFDNNIDRINLQKLGDIVNKQKEVFPNFINLTTVEPVSANEIKIRTYERSCFEETEACGTGSSCAVYVSFLSGKVKSNIVNVKTKGGNLKVAIAKDNIFLIGNPTKVFEGLIEAK